MEVIKPEYIAEHLVLPEYFNFRIDSSGRRFYVRILDGEHVQTAPSVSAILAELKPGVGLLEFYKKNKPEDIEFISTFAALYGTIFHVLCGKILRGEKIPCSENYITEFIKDFCYTESEDFFSLQRFIKIRKRKMLYDLIAFSKWVKDYNVKPLAIEYPVMTKKFGGTIDLVAEIDLKKKIKKTELIESAKNKYIDGYPEGLSITKIRKMKKEKLLDLLGMSETNRVIAVIDFKSGQHGFYKPHIMQLHAYMKGWNTEQTKNKATHIFNYGSEKFKLPNVKYKFADQTDNAQVFREWDALLKLFYTDSEKCKIKGRYEIIENEDITNTEIRYIDPIKQRLSLDMEAF